MFEGAKKRFQGKVFRSRFLFPALVLVLYIASGLAAPEKTIQALNRSVGIFYHLLMPLLMVFGCMVGINALLDPSRVAEFLGRGSVVKKQILSVAAGFLSTGPIYAWYPLLKELREKGAAFSLIAVFLVNRSVKPFLLPLMITFFGWPYVAVFTGLTVVGSLGVGVIVGLVLDPLAVSSPKYGGGNASKDGPSAGTELARGDDGKTVTHPPRAARRPGR